MEEWKFLLQKDGDRSWLPLDSPDVEILEGRYRIVAQTSHDNTDINIRICHLATEEDPPKRRIQKRSNRSNANGLMVVIPFTHLQAGLWEFSCFLADPMSDLVGDTLTHAVRLQVAACMAVEEDVWDEPQEPSGSVDVEAYAESSGQEELAVQQDVQQADEQESSAQEVVPAAQDLAALNLEIAEALGLSMDRLVEMTDQLSHQLVEEIFKEFNFVPYAIAPKSAVSQEPVSQEADAIAESEESVPVADDCVSQNEPVEEIQPVSISALQLVLEKDTWIARRGESFTIAGQVKVNDHLGAETIDSSYPTTVLLRDNSMAEGSSIADLALTELEGAEPKEIHLRLRDPQTSKVIFTACQSYPTGLLPQAFSFLCNLPEDLTTHLVLGEMLLCGTLPGAENALITFKSFDFTITVDPEALVEELQKVKTAISEEAALENLPDFVAEFSEKLLQEKDQRRLDLSFLNLATTVSAQTDATEQGAVKASSRMVPKQSSKQIFPPQIYEPDEVQAGKRKVELPAFATVGANHSSNSAIAQLEVEDVEGSETAFAMSTAELESMLVTTPTPHQGGLAVDEDFSDESSFFFDSSTETSPEPSSDAIEPTTGDGDDFSNFNDDNLAEPSIAADNYLADDLLGEPEVVEDRDEQGLYLQQAASPIKAAFQALNLQDRFLDRLNSLAADAELLALMKPTPPESDEALLDSSDDLEDVTDSLSEPEIGLDNEPQAHLAETSDVTDVNLLGAVEEPATEEVVVDDDPSWREWVKRAGSRLNKVEPDKKQEQQSSYQPPKKPLSLPLEDPVPTPIVELISTRAIAGRPIGVRVKLLNGPSKVYVKLWMNDRQTRSLLDGPRWLVDFLPNGFDELEANTQITAPFGSVEVRLEAIAVEMHSQRESQKVSIDCEVLPPDVPDELFDELDLI